MTNWTPARVLFVVVASVGLVGCGVAGDDNRTTGAKAVSCDDAPVSRFVEVRDNEFGMDSVSVPVGEAVEWSVAGTNPHSVTSGAVDTPTAGELFDSGGLRRADSFCVTFTEPGEFQYHCKYHSGSGDAVVVNVEAADDSQ